MTSKTSSLLAGSEGLYYRPRSRPASWKASPAAPLLRNLALSPETLACAAELVDLVAGRHLETAEHLLGCATLSRNLGRALGWHGDNLDRLVVAGLLHDVGKLIVPSQVLEKPGALTRAERGLIRRHAEIGAGLLEGTGLPDLDVASDVAFHHHERWDGGGYPTGMSGGDIPWAARIVGLVDVWDAMRSTRGYRPAHTDDVVLDLVAAERGRSFDPDVVDCFLELDPRLRGSRPDRRNGLRPAAVPPPA